MSQLRYAQVVRVPCPECHVSAGFRCLGLAVGVLHLARVREAEKLAKAEAERRAPSPTLPFLDPVGETKRRDEAIDRVEAHAPEDWNVAAYQAVLRVARQLQEFTTDDVWQALAAYPNERRAIGATMRDAARTGVCSNTGRVVKSQRAGCHRRPVTVWLSHVFQGKAAEVAS